MASKPEKKPSYEIPQHVAGAALLRRKRVNKRTLPSYTEAMMLLHAPEAQRLFWQSLLKGVEKGHKDSMRMAGEIFGLVEKSGINITQQLLQQNVVAGDTSPVRGFDSLVRELADARNTKELPAPAAVHTIEVRPAESVPVGE